MKLESEWCVTMATELPWPFSVFALHLHIFLFCAQFSLFFSFKTKIRLSGFQSILIYSVFMCLGSGRNNMFMLGCYALTSVQVPSPSADTGHVFVHLHGNINPSIFLWTTELVFILLTLLQSIIPDWFKSFELKGIREYLKWGCGQMAYY